MQNMLVSSLIRKKSKCWGPAVPFPRGSHELGQGRHESALLALRLRSGHFTGLALVSPLYRVESSVEPENVQNSPYFRHPSIRCS
jgi:hypothetical protein